MKKILVTLILLLSLCGCSDPGKEVANLDKRYLTLVELLQEYDNFLDNSNFYDISVEMAKIDEGYRYYVTIENPTVAMYDIEALAIEKDVDYTNTMAANIGIFEEKEYSMIPNQKNTDKGYYTGVIMSGVTDKPETTLYIFVSFKNKDYSVNHSEYFKLNVKYGEE